MTSLNYKPPGEVSKAFMRSDAIFRGIRGPVGSGKSVCCSVEIMRRAAQQEPGKNGKRRSRWAVVRNTNPQLRTTTIKTWLDWFPEGEWGKFQWSVPYTHNIRAGEIELEVIFLALDRPEDVKKLLSLELTGVWVNEAREVPKSIIDACTMRVGRFPSMKDGGPTWYGVICDTNAPEEDHWWPIMAGEAPLPDHISQEESLMLIKPDDWEFFTQPAGMIEQKDGEGNLTGYELNREAENIENLTPEYYPNIIKGKGRSWINVYVMNRLGVLQDGKAVWPMFREEVHLANAPLLPNPEAPIYVGIDFGLTPAAVFGQKMFGTWNILGEVVAENMGAVKFSEVLKHEIMTRFPEHELDEFKMYGDPAGDFRAQTDESTPFQILRANGLYVIAAPTNDPIIRVEAVSSTLERMVDGKPGFRLDPSAMVLRKAFQGGYSYKRLNVSGAERYSDKPDKNRFSHVADALQYMMVGAGEGRQVLGHGKGGTRPVVAKQNHNVFDRMAGRRKNRKRPSWNVFA